MASSLSCVLDVIFPKRIYANENNRCVHLRQSAPKHAPIVIAARQKISICMMCISLQWVPRHSLHPHTHTPTLKTVRLILAPRHGWNVRKMRKNRGISYLTCIVCKSCGRSCGWVEQRLRRYLSNFLLRLNYYLLFLLRWEKEKNERKKTWYGKVKIESRRYGCDKLIYNKLNRCKGRSIGIATRRLWSLVYRARSTFPSYRLHVTFLF